MMSIGSNSSTNSNNFNQQIRSRISSFKNSVFNPQKMYKPAEKTAESPNMSGDNSRSWFHRWNFKQPQQDNSNNSVNTSVHNASMNSSSHHASNASMSSNSGAADQDKEKEKEYTFVINDRPLNSVKADLIHAFLSTQDLIHNINSPMLFRCEYRSPDKFLARNVRFKVEILVSNPAGGAQTSSAASTPGTPSSNGPLTNNINISNNAASQPAQANPTFRILFTLINGLSYLTRLIL